MMAVCAVLSLILWSSGFGYLIAGLIFGASVSLVNFFLTGKDLSRTAEQIVQTQKAAGGKKLLYGFFLRYAILALAFIVTARYDALAVPSFVVGLLLIQGLLYWEYLWGCHHANK